MNSLPEKIVNIIQINDIQDSFKFLDRENEGTISFGQVKAILSLFGTFYAGASNMSRRELENIIQNELSSQSRASLTDVKNLVAKIWYEGGAEQEQKELYHIFDKKEKGAISIDEMKSVLHAKLAVPFIDDEVVELYEMMGFGMEGSMSMEDFLKFERELSSQIQ